MEDAKYLRALLFRKIVCEPKTNQPELQPEVQLQCKPKPLLTKVELPLIQKKNM